MLSWLHCTSSKRLNRSGKFRFEKGEEVESESQGPSSTYPEAGSDYVASSNSSMSAGTGYREDSNVEFSNVFNHLRNGSRWETKTALRLLHSLNNEEKQKYLDQGGLQALVDFLDGRNLCKSTGMKVLVALLGLGVESQKVFVELGGVQLLVKSIQSRWRSFRRETVRAVPLVAAIPEGRHQIRFHGGIGMLVKLLAIGERSVRVDATRALSLLVQEYEGIKEIVEQGGLLVLYCEVLRENPDSTHAAVCTIADILGSGAGLQINMGEIPMETFLNILKGSAKVDTCTEVARMLARVAMVEEGVSLILSKNGPAYMQALLDLGQSDCEYWLLQTLGNLCSNAQGLESVMRTFPHLLQIFFVGNFKCRLEAMRCLSYAAGTNDSVRCKMKPCIPNVVDALRDESSVCRKLAAEIVSNLLLYEPSKNWIVEAGGLPGLIRLLGSEDVMVQEAAACALARLATEKAYAPLILSEGAFKLLTSMLKDGELKAEWWAVKCLALIAHSYLFIQAMDQSSLLGTLAAFLRLYNVQIKRISAVCIANIVEDRENLQKFVLSLGVMGPLIEMLKSGNDSLKNAAVYLLARICHLDACKGEMYRTSDVIVMLIPMIEQKTGNIQQHIASILADLATIRGAALAHIQAHHKLIELLDSVKPPVVGQASRALANFAVHSGIVREILAQPGTLQKLTLLLEHSCNNVKAHAADCIAAVIDQNFEYQNRVSLYGGATLLVKMTRLDHDQCRANGARGIAALVAENSICQELVSDEEGVHAVAQLLGAEDDECCCQAALAVANLTHQNPEIQRDLVEAGGVPYLSNILNGKNLRAKRFAARTFANLATNSEAVVIEARRQAIAPLISMLSNGNIACQEHASCALANLACFRTEQTLISAHGGVAPLVKLVASGVPDTQEQAARAIANLSFQDSILQAIVDEGGISVLSGLLTSELEGCRRQAAGALANLISGNFENSMQLVDTGGIADLLNLLDDESEGCREQAIRTVGNLACSPKCQEVLLEAGAVQQMLSLLLSVGETPSMKHKVVRAINKLASNNEDIQLVLLNGGVVEPLMELLKEADKPAWEEATRAVMLLAFGTCEKGANVSEIQGARAHCMTTILDTFLPADEKKKKSCHQEKGALQDDLPRYFICPITHEALQDPVIAADGYTYERSAILKWFETRRSSPMTNELLETSHVIPNHLLTSMMHDMKSRQKK